MMLSVETFWSSVFVKSQGCIGYLAFWSHVSLRGINDGLVSEQSVVLQITWSIHRVKVMRRKKSIVQRIIRPDTSKCLRNALWNCSQVSLGSRCLLYLPEMSPFEVFGKAFKAVNVTKSNRHLKRQLSPEESCTCIYESPTEGIPGPYLFHGQFSELTLWCPAGNATEGMLSSSLFHAQISDPLHTRFII